MAPILYTVKGSPAVRSVLIIAKALNVTLEERTVDFINGEHLKPEYLQINPLHTLPTLNDNGNVICDSHVINTYLIGKYGNDDSLYPKDLYQRALVEQKLAFNIGILFPVLREVDLAYIRGEIKSIQPKMVEEIKNVYNFLEMFLTDSAFIAYNSLSLADVHCFTTVSCLNFHVNINEDSYPNTFKWMKRCQELPLFSDDDEEMRIFEKYFSSLQT